MCFLRQDSGWSDLILARGKVFPGKGSKKSQRANLATLPWFWLYKG